APCAWRSPGPRRRRAALAHRCQALVLFFPSCCGACCYYLLYWFPRLDDGGVLRCAHHDGALLSSLAQHGHVEIAAETCLPSLVMIIAVAMITNNCGDAAHTR
ncbi:unnamed protein product, partial [Heterosigma akashiwo]